MSELQLVGVLFQRSATGLKSLKAQREGWARALQEQQLFQDVGYQSPSPESMMTTHST
jgi:hypothetical protein